MIEVENYSKIYRNTEAVRGLSFTVEPGQIMGLVGPNGAGKTTTLRALSGIIRPTEGSLRIAGHDIVTDSIEAKRRLAYVPDDPKLFTSLTIWEHLQFIASAYEVDDMKPKAEALLEKFDLVEKRGTIAHELSRGMRQRVAVICALLHDPVALFFDEPIAGLDPRGIRTLKTTIAEQAERGAAVIISSHQLALVEDVCSHLLILHRGRRVFFGPVSEARSAVEDLAEDATLEEIFLRVTEDTGVQKGSDH